jgi:hypothetical protein
MNKITSKRVTKRCVCKNVQRRVQMEIKKFN